MNDNFDIVIIGGGVVGLSLALALDDKKHRIAVIDSKKLEPSVLTDEFEPRVYAINHSSVKLFQSLNVWPEIAKRSSPYERMHVWEGRHKIEFDCRDVANQCLGYIIEEAVIKNALLNEVQKKRVALLSEIKIDRLISGESKMHLAVGDAQFDVKLLVGADGANSWVRQQLNVDMTSWDYNHHAIVAHVQTEMPHQKTAWQRFTDTGTLAFLPMSLPNHSSIVWSTHPTHAHELLRMDSAQFMSLLSQAFELKLGDVKKVTQRFSFPLKMRHVKQYAGENWVLIGDAAHTIHPLAGQGVNLGLKDVISLAKHLQEKDRGYSLAKFQRERKNQVWKMIVAMEGFKRLFAPQIAPLTAIRGLGLSLCDNFMPVKRFFIDQAMN